MSSSKRRLYQLQTSEGSDASLDLPGEQLMKIRESTDDKP